jgi:hypothetical protein
MDKTDINNEEQKTAIERKLHESAIAESELNKAGYFRSPLLDFLKTESGSKFGEKVVNLLDILGQKYHTTYKWDTVSKVGCIIAVVVATSVLLCLGKFEPSVGILFGTIVGYLFGKDSRE